MKKSIAFLFALFIAFQAFAQHRPFTLSYIASLESGYNKGIVPVKIENVDSLLRVLKKKKLAYSVNSYNFNGEYAIQEDSAGFGSGQTIINDRRKRFIYYKETLFLGSLSLVVISGTDAL
ncbi:MAG: hypothetical protein ACKO5C_05130 [Ferruginibacter sp.]